MTTYIRFEILHQDAEPSVFSKHSRSRTAIQEFAQEERFKELVPQVTRLSRTDQLAVSSSDCWADQSRNKKVQDLVESHHAARVGWGGLVHRLYSPNEKPVLHFQYLRREGMRKWLSGRVGKVSWTQQRRLVSWRKWSRIRKRLEQEARIAQIRKTSEWNWRFKDYEGRLRLSAFFLLVRHSSVWIPSSFSSL